MSFPIPLRGDFDAARLRGLAKKTKDGPQARRLLGSGLIDQSQKMTEAAMQIADMKVWAHRS